MAPKPSEADIIFNRANVALAKSQRLVASWLPPPTAAEEAASRAKTDSDIEKEEQELFTPVPELLGLGAKVPDDLTDSSLKKQKNLTSNDILRRQLLGKDHAKIRSGESQRLGLQRGDGAPMLLGSKPRPAPAKRKVEDSSSGEEGGRSSLGKKKHREHSTSQNDTNGTIDKGIREDGDGQGRRLEPVKQPKKAANYLDEVLALKRERKHKGKKRQKGLQQESKDR